MVGSMVSGMDVPIKVRTKEKLVIYTVWEVTVDTDSKLVEVSGGMKHIPEDTDNSVQPKGLIGRMKEAELLLLGAVQPKDYILDAIVVPQNSIIIIDGEKYIKCGIVSENHAVVSDNYIIENVAEINCPTYKELAEMVLDLEALGYRLNSFTFKYDLMVLTILRKNNLIQLS